ncbi:MAG: thiolase family protein, partial [Armatimonadota bacterium]|nr:thiolase family protein [Armatimonadota bacterium]
LVARMRDRYRLEREWFDQAEGAERIARRWGFGREDLDRFGLESHRRASAAQRAGRFEAEIVPVGGLAADEGIRHDTSLEKMLSLPPAFPHLELITAGNSSQISDGASAALIVSPRAAEALGLRVRARFVSFAVVGVDPVTMLTGPIPATWKALERAGLRVEDVDLFEVNEAFASVVLAWQREFRAPWDRVNVNGGAIALGHPLGATGTRILATLLHEMERRRARHGLIAICEGGGMANATVIERLP